MAMLYNQMVVKPWGFLEIAKHQDLGSPELDGKDQPSQMPKKVPSGND